MGTHTPGPWAASLDQRHEKWLITAADGEIEICQDRGWGDEYESEDYANARLIAAAPDLLRELKHLRTCLHPWIESGHRVPGIATLNGADAAIAKATGAES